MAFPGVGAWGIPGGPNTARVRRGGQVHFFSPCHLNSQKSSKYTKALTFVQVCIHIRWFFLKKKFIYVCIYIRWFFLKKNCVQAPSVICLALGWQAMECTAAALVCLFLFPFFNFPFFFALFGSSLVFLPWHERRWPRARRRARTHTHTLTRTDPRTIKKKTRPHPRTDLFAGGYLHLWPLSTHTHTHTQGHVHRRACAAVMQGGGVPRARTSAQVFAVCVCVCLCLCECVCCVCV
jgi:hypothetical protein